MTGVAKIIHSKAILNSRGKEVKNIYYTKEV
jgi:hypothetical protein